MYSAGGPTGEIHQLEEGKIGEKVQDLLYVAPEELELADKTRKSLVSTLDSIIGQ